MHSCFQHNNNNNNETFIRLEISISEGSCATEDWRNDAENSVFHHHRNKINDVLKYIKIVSR